MRRSVSPFTFTSLVVGVMALMVFFAPFSMSQNPMKELTGTPPEWSSDINLSNSPLRDMNPSIALNNNEVHVVWEDVNVSTGVTNILYMKSLNNGLSWDPTQSLVTKSNYIGNPDIDLNGNNLHVVWEDTQGWNGIYYRNSTDSGGSWNSIKRISSDGVDATGPKIFVNNSNIHIIWLDLRGSDQEMYYRRSVDGGITFDNGRGVDEDRRLTFASADVSYVRMAGDKSNISVLWCDESNGGDWDVFWMISMDNGYTWENGLGVQNIGRLLTVDSTTSIDPAIAVDGSNFHVIWVDEQWPGPVYRLYYRNSTDNGITWNPTQLLTGPVPGINSPDIDVQGNDISVVWDDERDDGYHEQIYYKNSSDGGITWSDDLRLTYDLSCESYWPRIAVNSETKHVTWFNYYGGSSYYEVYYKRSPDFPDTSPPSHSNEIPLPDSYKDAPGTNVSVHVTDPSGVNASSIQLWVNGSLVSHVALPITDGYNVSWVSGGFSPGVVTCRIVAEDMLGNVLDYTWNFTVLANYIIPLSPGWNLISLPLEQVENSPQAILDSIVGQYDAVKYYDALDNNDHWKTYRPGSSMNDLMGIDNTMGIWIKITGPYVNLTVRGIIPTSTYIPLYAGWNLVGYPSQTMDTVANVLWGTGTDRVEVFNPVAPYLIEVGATYVMKPGEGYWVHVTADTVWTIDW